MYQYLNREAIGKRLGKVSCDTLLFGLTVPAWFRLRLGCCLGSRAPEPEARRPQPTWSLLSSEGNLIEGFGVVEARVPNGIDGGVGLGPVTARSPHGHRTVTARIQQTVITRLAHGHSTRSQHTATAHSHSTRLPHTATAHGGGHSTVTARLPWHDPRRPPLQSSCPPSVSHMPETPPTTPPDQEVTHG